MNRKAGIPTIVVAAIFLTVATNLHAQSLTSDPQGLKLATQALTALTGGAPVADVSLNANVIWIAGSDYLTGTATLKAKGLSESRIDFSLGNTTRSEIRTVSGGFPTGSWAKNAATPQALSVHNCWTDAAWFFPALSSLAQVPNPNFSFSYVGLEKHGGVSAQHLRLFQVFPQDTKGLMAVERLSATDVYLDPASMLPLAIAFRVHPDDNMLTDIPMEIRFANYQSVNGVQVPFHVQRMLNGGIVLDVVVTNAAINTGISASSLTLQ